MPQLASNFDHLRELKSRGVSNPDEFADHAELVSRGIKWFDAQNGRVGAGVLVEHLRKAIAKEIAKADPTVTTMLDPTDVGKWIIANAPELVVDGKANEGAVLEGWRVCWMRGLTPTALAGHLDRLHTAAQRWDTEQTA